MVEWWQDNPTQLLLPDSCLLCTQVTEETAQIVESVGYGVTLRGVINVKGKGELTTYFVNTEHSSPTFWPPSSLLHRSRTLSRHQLLICVCGCGGWPRELLRQTWYYSVVNTVIGEEFTQAYSHHESVTCWSLHQWRSCLCLLDETLNMIPTC